MMFADQNRAALRASWREAWRRHCERLPLEPLQAQIADVVTAHPEYHALLASDSEWSGPENPFLHMSLHLAIREQVGTDRPAGVRALHRQLSERHGSAHEAEHRMIEVLATLLWDAQRAGRAPDEMAYLEALRRL